MGDRIEQPCAAVIAKPVGPQFREYDHRRSYRARSAGWGGGRGRTFDAAAADLAAAAAGDARSAARRRYRLRLRSGVSAGANPGAPTGDSADAELFDWR